MGITVRLSDGVELHVGDRDFEAVVEAFKTALDQNKLLEIHNPEGRRVWVNPHSVLYFEGPSSDSENPDPVENGHMPEARVQQAVPL